MKKLKGANMSASGKPHKAVQVLFFFFPPTFNNSIKEKTPPKYPMSNIQSRVFRNMADRQNEFKCKSLLTNARKCNYMLFEKIDPSLL